MLRFFWPFYPCHGPRTESFMLFLRKLSKQVHNWKMPHLHKSSVTASLDIQKKVLCRVYISLQLFWYGHLWGLIFFMLLDYIKRWSSSKSNIFSLRVLPQVPVTPIFSMNAKVLKCIRVGQSCRVLDPCKYLQGEFRCVDSAAADTASLTCEKEGSYVLRLNKHWTYYFILQHKEVLIFYRNAP